MPNDCFTITDEYRLEVGAKVFPSGVDVLDRFRWNQAKAEIREQRKCVEATRGVMQEIEQKRLDALFWKYRAFTKRCVR